MPFFGQVWVWSLAGFLVGAALCWLLIALPARKRATELEGRLTAVRKRESRLAAEDSGYTAALVPGFTDSRDDTGYVQPRRTGEDSIRRGLLTLSDEDENGLRSMPAPATGVDERAEYDRDDRLGHDDDGAERYDRDDHDDRDEREDRDDRADRFDGGRYDDEDRHDRFEGERADGDRLDDDRHGDDRDDDERHDDEDRHGDERHDDDQIAGDRLDGDRLAGDDERVERDWDREPEPSAAELTQYIPPAVESGTDYREDAAAEVADYRDGFRAAAEQDADREGADYREGFRAAAEHADDPDWFDRDRPDRLVDDLDESVDSETESPYYADDDRPARGSVPGDHSAEDHRFAGDHAPEDDADDLDDERPAAGYERDDDTGTIFTQHTTPIPAELIRRIDAEGAGGEVDHAAPVNGTALSDAALVDDLDDEPDFDRTGFLDPEAVARYGDHAASGDLTDDEQYAPVSHDTDEETPERRADDPALNTVDATRFALAEPVEPEVERQPAHAAVELEPVGPVEQEPALAVTDQPGFQQPIQPTPAYAEALPERSSSVLPKRVPAKPQNRFPFGVQTSSAPAAPVPAAIPEPVAVARQTTPDRERSLFEPILPADTAEAAKPAPPPPNRLRGARTLQQSPSGVDPFVPPGPFGPGSAMPLPGGRSPSSEYTIKASVTALRYCAPDSAKFDRTVAEVWFRSVADAERVGFRPLG
ncbi:hypothetical protein [Actinokineospora globicatena]|uniref:sunset domain-containing protein n=1 Tax=Actinokineospora globicatena TaxID=103729 RepID=UPI0020A56C1A|nr:hypothetical protein [Actinokineospora globicatena]MCP2301749.1 hypothetical protein [Actinokineospora globicatena]GLW76593.1 hypothetical protein Aglo01_10750 [Actinokineospora globicatena]GLW83427.1 hypothetical protein Aglo02_10670 [Actinokineospora globicatena]